MNEAGTKSSLTMYFYTREEVAGLEEKPNRFIYSMLVSLGSLLSMLDPIQKSHCLGRELFVYIIHYSI